MNQKALGMLGWGEDAVTPETTGNEGVGPSGKLQALQKPERGLSLPNQVLHGFQGEFFARGAREEVQGLRGRINPSLPMPHGQVPPGSPRARELPGRAPCGPQGSGALEGAGPWEEAVPRTPPELGGVRGVTEPAE